nr:type I polyketide synthase [Streptomyces sp. QL37]PPQ56489.1 beta keto-acyl synthase [Streptomyces sp. QL37]
MHHSRLAETPIAIVGLAGLFPQSRNVREFWHNIVDGNDCIEDVPDTHWNLDDYYDPDPTAEDKTYARRGGFLPEIAFNPMEFGLPPNTLEVTDILQLLSLTVARDVLRDAGTEGSGWYDPTRTGVILGVTGANSLTQPLSARLQTPVLKEVVRSVGLSEAQAEEVAERFKKAYIPWEENSFPGMLGNVVAGRIANRFDLGGTNCTVDAACASALAAVKLAVSELVEGRSDLMITGGCDAENTILMYMCFSKTPAFSKSQIIRPFDESADGTLIGEGIGMLALKRLADAERDGDRIYSVLRGIGTSSDGRFKSIYAPRAQGQQLALRRAYEDADVPAGSIELFEAHGTGTAVGDHTELSALGSFVAEGQEARGYAAIGSVKSQIGHTKAAAGAAGLIKLSLALHQKVLPPTINVEQPSAAVDPTETPFYVNSQARPWIADPGRDKRRAAVSSFGFGGTNFHMVLEEHDTTGGKVLGPVARTGLWHAADPEALARRVEQGAAPDPLGWVPVGDARIGIVAGSDEEFEALRTTAVELLRSKSGADAWQHPKGITYRRSGVPAGTKAAAVFAGQGSQYVGMGREAALAVPPVLAAYDRANRLTAGAETLGRVVFPPPAFDDATRKAQEELLRRTEFAQPAIGALSAGQFAWFKELGFAPDGVIGHSFGELTALWAAGVLDDDGFTELARARGLAMAPPADASGSHDPGAMAAVRGELSAVEALVAGYQDVSVCNINAPGQIVVGGPTAEIDRLVADAASGTIPAKRLPVSAAFHTRFVAHAADAFREAVSGVALNAPRVPVYANTPGASYGADQAESRRTLVDQLLRPVAFADRIEEMYADGFRVFVEFGPKRVLSELVDRVLEGRDGVRTVAVDGGPAKDGELALKRAVIELAVLGLPVSGIDDHSAEAPQVPAGKGMAIPLRGINYVTEARRSAYRDAIAEPSREAAPTAQPTVPEVSEPVTQPAEGTADALSAVAREGLDLQAEILDAHVETIREAVKTLELSVRSGTHPDADAALRLIEQHGASITSAHERATRLLIDALKSEETPAAALAEPAAAVPVVAEPAPAQAETSPAPAAPVAEVDAAVLGALLEVVAEKTGYPVEMLEPGMDVEADLGIDSIKRVQIMGALQERFPVSGEVDPERMGELRTLDDIAGFLASASGAAPSGSPAESAGSAVESPLVVTYPKADGVGRTFAAVRELPAVCRVVRAYAEQPVALVLDDGSTLTRPLVAGLRADGWRVEVVVLPGATTSAGEADSVRPLRTWDEKELAATVTAERLDLVVQMAAEGGQEWTEAARRLAHTVLVAKLTQGPLKAAAGDRAAFVAVTRLDGANGYRGSGTGSALLGGVSGLVKTLAIEVPSLFTRTVDFAPGLDDRTVAARFLDEIHDVSADLADVGVDPEGRRTIVPSAEPPAAHVTAVEEIGARDLLVVTGGARGITADCLQALAEARPVGLLLLGRSQVTPEPEWSAGVDGAALKGLIAKRITASGEKATPRGVEAIYRELTGSREIRANLDRLRGTGATVEYLVVDITDAAAVRAALAPYAPRVTGVVHGAGVLADRLIADKTPEEIARVLGTKIVGLGHVLDALRGPADLRHLVFFSSVAGFFGNRGQSDYAVANEALNRLAVRLRQELPSARVTSVNWGAWDGGMVTDDLRRMFASRGVALVPVATGAGMFAEQFTAARGQDTVVVAGPLTPLSAPPAEGSPASPTLLVDRTLADISADPLLADHTIGGNRVLPATAALGALVNTTERVTGKPVTEVSAFKVFKGLVMDAAEGEGADASRLRLFIEPGPATRPHAIEVLASAVDEAGRSRPSYGASLSTDAPPVPADRTDLARAARAAIRTDAAPLYRDGTLFHGPALRGIRSVLVAEEGLLLLGARLGDGLPARGAYHGRFHSPVIADLLLQSALVWVRRFRNRASLPMEIGSARFHAELPADQEFLIAVENVTSGPSGITCSITALDREGRVLQALDGVVVVEDPQLEGKFGAADRTGTAPVSV